MQLVRGAEPMTARTIVGSGPRRRPLPLGREAVERALRTCKFWQCDMPIRAAIRAERVSGQRDGTGMPSQWLPGFLDMLTVKQLRERLRGYP
jgi:hypothetical protein